jgi:hypothetical protein
MAVKICGRVFDDEMVIPGGENVRKKGYKIHDVYTPFAIHGLIRL